MPDGPTFGSRRDPCHTAGMRVARRHLVAGAQWAVGLWLLARLRRPAPLTDTAPLDGVAPCGSGTSRRRRVSVLIPARNEELALPHLLASLNAQTAPADEVLVIDDASSDCTASLARSGGATVLTSSGLPDGWSGKCWALHQGQAAASGDVLVFLDADVTLSPDGLARVAAEHDRMGGSGLVSVEPYHRTVRPYEQLSSVANVVALMGTGAFTGPPARSPTMAFGPCLAIDRDTYDCIGGHAHPDVRSKITEDLAMARRTRGIGRPVEVLTGGDVVAFRMYPEGPRQLVEGWTNVLATGARGGPPWITAAVALWISGALAASVAGGRAVVSLLTRRRPTSWPTGTAADLAAYSLWAGQMGWHFHRVGRFGPATAALFPLPLAAFVGCFARSAVKTGLGRPLAWRGRALTGR